MKTEILFSKIMLLTLGVFIIFGANAHAQQESAPGLIIVSGATNDEISKKILEKLIVTTPRSKDHKKICAEVFEEEGTSCPEGQEPQIFDIREDGEAKEERVTTGKPPVTTIIVTQPVKFICKCAPA